MMDIGRLVEHGPCMKFKAGANIPCPGSHEPEKKAMYILLVGRVDVYKKSAAGGTQTIASLLKGDVFGGREYFTDADDCTYIAGVDSAVYVITRDSFNDLSWSRPEILFDILRAAYMPLRKMTAAARETQQQQPQKEQPQQQEEAVPEVQEKPVLPAPSPSSVPIAASASSIYPEGHKNYPGIVKPEYMKLVFPKEYNCPFCKKEFKDYRVFRSKLYENAPMRYDLRKFYSNFETEWYDILTCRHCFFSAFHNYFTDPKPMQKSKIEKALIDAQSETTLDFDAERGIDFVFTAHYLAMLCSDGYPSMGNQLRAKLWGNLSWLYEDVEDKEMERFAAIKAAETYELVYTGSRLTPVQEQITCLSIAGMQHRAGIDNNLKKFLFTAKTQTGGDKMYAKLAEDFMYELKMEEQ